MAIMTIVTVVSFVFLIGLFLMAVLLVFRCCTKHSQDEFWAKNTKKNSDEANV